MQLSFPKLPLTTQPTHVLLLYLQFRVKYIMCQILPHTTNLISTKEVGLIATLPSRGETLKLQTLAHTTTEMWILFPPSLSFSACKARLLQEEVAASSRRIFCSASCKPPEQSVWELSHRVNSPLSSFLESLWAGTVSMWAASSWGLAYHRCFRFPHLNWIPVRVTGCFLKMNHHLRRLKSFHLGLMLFLCWFQLGLINQSEFSSGWSSAPPFSSFTLWDVSLMDTSQREERGGRQNILGEHPFLLLWVMDHKVFTTAREFLAETQWPSKPREVIGGNRGPLGLVENRRVGVLPAGVHIQS